jgi:hypothetical protein
MMASTSQIFPTVIGIDWKSSNIVEDHGVYAMVGRLTGPARTPVRRFAPRPRSRIFLGRINSDNRLLEYKFFLYFLAGFTRIYPDNPESPKTAP